MATRKGTLSTIYAVLHIPTGYCVINNKGETMVYETFARAEHAIKCSALPCKLMDYSIVVLTDAFKHND